MSEERGFFSRWSQRKAMVERGERPPEPLPPAPDQPVPAAPPVAQPAAQPRNIPLAAAEQPRAAIATAPPAAASASTTPAAPAAPTLDDALALRPDSPDFSRFVSRGVDPQVKHRALKTLFSDPHFNVMDGLDVYIDDYNTPDPLPSGMLRKMVQSSMLGLFDDKPGDPASAATGAQPAAPQPPVPTAPADAALSESPAPTLETFADEDPAVRLQPDDEAGPAGDQPGAGESLDRQH